MKSWKDEERKRLQIHAVSVTWAFVIRGNYQLVKKLTFTHKEFTRDAYWNAFYLNFSVSLVKVFACTAEGAALRCDDDGVGGGGTGRGDFYHQGIRQPTRRGEGAFARLQVPQVHGWVAIG